MSATETKTYNGWTNYETWNVALWLGNDEGSDRYWRATAQECWDESDEEESTYARLTGKEIFTREERAVRALSERLESEIRESEPELGASMWADLLGAAVSEVNWHEIAQGYIDDVDRDDEDDDDEDDEE